MFTDSQSDSAILRELSARLRQHRLAKNLTQAQLAHEAGVSKGTLERLEAGRSTQLTNFLRIVRALGLLDNLNALVPTPLASPLDLLAREGAPRQRARSPSAKADTPWSWADEP